MRQDNGYRLYSEKDLLTLQQIIALKFFGFELSQIKMLLVSKVNMLEHFAMQADFLQEKAKTLKEANRILKRLASQCSEEKSIPWEHIIQLIEVYHMTQKLEHAWVKDALNPDELKQYIAFEENLKSRSTLEEKVCFEKNWFNLIEEIKQNLSCDPQSEVGVRLGRQCIELTNKLYGKENIALRTALWEKGFKDGKNLGKHGLTKELVTWLDNAINAYWWQRIYGVLAQVESVSAQEMDQLWNKVLADMFGNKTESSATIIAAAISDSRVSHAAKNWLKLRIS